jgi:hypothetical protein
VTDPAQDRTAKIDPSTAASGTSGPTKAHGDPLLAASEGATEGTEGTRHGLGATEPGEDAQD